jgi:hypothetical protein
MTKNFFRPSLSLAVAAVVLLFSTGCQQRVVLTPGEDDLVVLNGCVVSACNYLAVVKTQNALDKNFWAKILLVRFENHPAGHAYCVWETEHLRIRPQFRRVPDPGLYARPAIDRDRSGAGTLANSQ